MRRVGNVVRDARGRGQTRARGRTLVREVRVRDACISSAVREGRVSRALLLLILPLHLRSDLAFAGLRRAQAFDSLNALELELQIHI